MILLNIDTPQTFFDWINTGGIIGLLAFIIVGGARRWWVFGWQYKELLDRYQKIEESNVMWMQVALRGVSVTEQIVKTVAPDGGTNVQK